jgi:hypothetical protein
MSQVRVSRKAGADNIARGEVPQLASLKLGLPTSTQFKDGLIRLWSFPSHPPQSSVFWSYSLSTGRPSASPRVISLFIWLPYVWTYLSTSDTEGYLRLRSKGNPMHTCEELSSFTIENAILDSNKISIQHYYDRTKQCCFAFIYWSKFIPTF